jgi:hypothetical protein
MPKKDASAVVKRPATSHITAEYHLNALTARHRQAIDEIVTANQATLDNLQIIWSRQCDMAVEALRGLSTIMAESAAEPSRTVDPRISEYAARSRQVFENNLVLTRELTEIAAATTKELNMRASRQARQHINISHGTAPLAAN